MFDGLRSGFSRPAPEQVPAGDKPKRSMFDGLKLSAGPASPAPAKAAERGQDRSYVQAVERTARAAQAIIQAQERGAPVLEHQKVALETARGTLEQIRPGASRDMIAAIERDPGLIGEAAAGRSGPMLTAINTEARVRTDPVLRADRFVERWQGLRQERDQLYRAGDMAGREKAGQALAGMAKSLERDPQVESILRGRTRELGLEIGKNRSHDFGRGDLGRELALELGMGRGRDLGMSR
jgi:hypothetical protein